MAPRTAQSRGEAVEAHGAGGDGGAQLAELGLGFRVELARLQERASQLQGYALGTLDHAELMALIEQQMQARRHAERQPGRTCMARPARGCEELAWP